METNKAVKKIYINGIGLISYNLKNGSLKYKKIFKQSADNDNDLKISENNKKDVDESISQTEQKYWIIKDNNHKFKILILNQNLYISSLNSIKAGPFATLEEAQNVLDLLRNWNYSYII